jgi:hypothetical protein
VASGVGCGVAAIIGGAVVHGADHRDSTLLAMAANSAADINDVYAWMNDGATKVNLVMTVQPFASASATFSPNVQYVLHVRSMASYGAATSEDTQVICELASPTSVECWVGDAYVTGDPSDPDGVTSEDGMIKVFAGQRKDPFFFNLDGFNQAVRDTLSEVAASNVTFDANGCAQLSNGQSALLVNDLTHDSDGSAAATTLVDDFATGNVAALVIQIDKSLVNGGGDILAVYGSTHEVP